MRIAYFYERNDARGSGVFRKIIMQATQWRAQGHEVALFNLSHTHTAADWQAALPPEITFTQIVWSSVWERLKALDGLIRQIIAWKPSMIYTRHGLYYPSYERIIGKIPIVLEINSDELNEARLRSAAAYQYRKLTRWRMLSNAAGLVFVSHELKSNRHFAPFVDRHRVIPNSIDLSIYTPLPAPQNPQPRLFFIGHPHIVFHGLDKIQTMARHFTDWHFDVVGPGPDDFNAPIPSNLHIHGLMSEDDYLPILALADVALATLALERKDMFEASPLKICEYMARGIPTITGYKDTNFMPPPDFILELPAIETNVTDNLSRIEQFVNTQVGKRVPVEAIQHIDMRHTEAERLAFFESVARG